MFFSWSLIQIRSLEISSAYVTRSVCSFNALLSRGIALTVDSKFVKKFAEKARISARLDEYLICSAIKL